jgi:hypothetical protein
MTGDVGENGYYSNIHGIWVIGWHGMVKMGKMSGKKDDSGNAKFALLLRH